MRSKARKRHFDGLFILPLSLYDYRLKTDFSACFERLIAFRVFGLWFGILKSINKNRLDINLLIQSVLHFTFRDSPSDGYFDFS